MNSELSVILKDQNVSKENATILLGAFGAPFEEAGAVLSMHKTIVVKSEDDFAMMAEAREKRLILKNVRVEVEKKRKELKEDSLRTGRAIDTVARFVKETIEPAEEYLQLQEDFSKIIAENKKAELRAIRIETLLAYTEDLSPYSIDDMSDMQFDSLVTMLKGQKELQLAEAKREADEAAATQKAYEAEQEAIRAENARLRAEADKREAEIEHARVVAENERKLEAEKQAKIDAARNAELEAERAKIKAIEDERQAEADKLASEQKAREEAERSALLSPDKDKLRAFAVGLEQVRTTKLPALKTKQAQDLLTYVDDELARLVRYINDEAKKLG